jgi:hypothetical protein
VSNGSRRNRRKGAPPPEGLVAPSATGAFVWLVVSGITSLFRRIFRRRR